MAQYLWINRAAVTKGSFSSAEIYSLDVSERSEGGMKREALLMLRHRKTHLKAWPWLPGPPCSWACPVGLVTQQAGTSPKGRHDRWGQPSFLHKPLFILVDFSSCQEEHQSPLCYQHKEIKQISWLGAGVELCGALWPVSRWEVSGVWGVGQLGLVALVTVALEPFQNLTSERSGLTHWHLFCPDSPT